MRRKLEQLTDALKAERFGPGPWMDEPDRIEWESGDFPCLMVRNVFSGFWCGYVAMPPGHPWHGQGDDALSRVADVHGGVTYAASCGGTICHVPKPGKPDDVWWVGFDCGHSGDASPCTAKLWGMREWETYRDAAYVRTEVERLAEQARVAG